MASRLFDDDLQVVGQLLDALVLARAVVVRGTQSFRDLAEQHAVRHLVVARRRARARSRHDRLVVLDPVTHGLRDVGRAPLALAQLFGEALRLEEVAIDDQRVMPGTTLADGLGVHVRQPVHVAADPGAEMQQLRNPRLPRFVTEDQHQRFLDLLVEDRDHVVDDLDQEEEHVLALVRDRELLARIVGGLPAGREFAAHSLEGGAALDRRERRIEPRHQQARDALLLAQQGAARRFGRVGRKNRLDAQAPEQFDHLRQAVTDRAQLLEAFGEAAGLVGTAVVEVLPPPAHAVHLLGHVDHLEPGAECPDQFGGLLRRPAVGPHDQLHGGFRVAVAAADRHLPVALHFLEEGVAALVPQYFAHESAKCVDVLAERRILCRERNVFACHGREGRKT